MTASRNGFTDARTIISFSKIADESGPREETRRFPFLNCAGLIKIRAIWFDNLPVSCCFVRAGLPFSGAKHLI